MCERAILQRPLLYLSYYFKQNRTEYCDWLQAVRERGDWEGWLKFFLRGVAIVANEATHVARRLVGLRETDRTRIIERGRRTTGDALRLHEHLFEHPIVSIGSVQQVTGKEFPAASKLVNQLVGFGILTEITGRSRRRVYRHNRYFNLFNDEEVAATEVVPIDETQKTLGI